VAPLEPWEKVLVSQEDYLADVHGQMQCMFCHGGVQSPEKDIAHTDLIADPGAGKTQICETCHVETNHTFNASLHSTQEGYWTTLDARSSPEHAGALKSMFGNHCASCHTTCGDCHISQPNSVGGGLISGHAFEKTPSMTRNCTACHGSRVGNEYLGKNEGVQADVHFRAGRMNCVSCHSGMEMHDSTAACTQCHTSGESAELVNSKTRYAGAQVPGCEDCHTEIGADGDNIAQHSVHKEKLSCQVCHSVSYTSCDGCHVAISETTGNPFFETQDTYLTFLIGRNPNPNYHRPYEYVPVRHIPIDTESYAYYGENLLPNFDALPTWAYATPHNIQRNTPQTESCANCHGNPDIFLTIDKVNPEEVNANLKVIVEEIPAPLGAP
jgi:thiosulfate/3-mercaptopyruvate sulfurtransferase